MITINNITLPKGIFWHNSFDFVPIKQVNRQSTTGRTLLFRSQIQDGRAIDLTGTETSNQILRSDLEPLSALRALTEPFELNFNGTIHLVKFDLTDSKHFDVAPLWGDTTAHLPDSVWYIRSLKLIEVLA